MLRNILTATTTRASALSRVALVSTQRMCVASLLSSNMMSSTSTTYPSKTALVSTRSFTAQAPVDVDANAKSEVEQDAAIPVVTLEQVLQCSKEEQKVTLDYIASMLPDVFGLSPPKLVARVEALAAVLLHPDCIASIFERQTALRNAHFVEDSKVPVLKGNPSVKHPVHPLVAEVLRKHPALLRAGDASKAVDALSKLFPGVSPYTIIGRSTSVLSLDLAHKVPEKIAVLEQLLGGDRSAALAVITTQPDILHLDLSRTAPRRMDLIVDLMGISNETAVEIVKAVPRILSPAVRLRIIRRLSVFKQNYKPVQPQSADAATASSSSSTSSSAAAGATPEGLTGAPAPAVAIETTAAPTLAEELLQQGGVPALVGELSTVLFRVGERALRNRFPNFTDPEIKATSEDLAIERYRLTRMVSTSQRERRSRRAMGSTASTSRAADEVDMDQALNDEDARQEHEEQQGESMFADRDAVDEDREYRRLANDHNHKQKFTQKREVQNAGKGKHEGAKWGNRDNHTKTGFNANVKGARSFNETRRSHELIGTKGDPLPRKEAFRTGETRRPPSPVDKEGPNGKKRKPWDRDDRE